MTMGIVWNATLIGKRGGRQQIQRNNSNRKYFTHILALQLLPRAY
jgi:hypothetical protein